MNDEDLFAEDLHNYDIEDEIDSEDLNSPSSLVYYLLEIRDLAYFSIRRRYSINFEEVEMPFGYLERHEYKPKDCIVPKEEPGQEEAQKRISDKIKQNSEFDTTCIICLETVAKSKITGC